MAFAPIEKNGQEKFDADAIPIQFCLLGLNGIAVTTKPIPIRTKTLNGIGYRGWDFPIALFPNGNERATAML
jgi:hypothetical protein